jgi:hypothetical protein
MVAAAGCFDPRPPAGAPCGPGESCPAGLVCHEGVCVASAIDGGIADEDGASEPDSGACVAACAGDNLVCGASTVACVLGCDDAGEVRCRQLVPSNGVTWLLGGTAELVLTGRVRIDTSTGEIRDLDNEVTLRAAGAGDIGGITFATPGTLGVFGVASVTIAAGADVEVRGSRPLVLLVGGDVMIEGVLDASGGCSDGTKPCPGPGGGAGGTTGEAAGCGKGARGTDTSGGDYPTHARGGGGGGAREPGAIGAGGTPGGVACGPTSLEPLAGGSGGGRGGATAGGAGGGGGGALQISAAGAITIEASGVIDAGGAGGQTGQGTLDGGGGGGAGGAVLLEAERVTVAGVIATNGGAGGGHAPNLGNGEDGRRSAMPALGPTGSWGGGDGGTGTIAPKPGRAPDHGGGGGGAAGRIRILGVARDLTGVISPAAAEGVPAGE